MKLARTGYLLIALVAAGPLPAAALDGVQERIFEVHPLAGTFLPDDHASYRTGSPFVGFRATLNNSAWWGLEGTISISPGQQQRTRVGMLTSYQPHFAYDQNGVPVGVAVTDLVTEEKTESSDSNLMMAGGAMVFHLARGGLRPFLSVGVGIIDDISNGNGDPPAPFSNVYWDAGIGLKYYRRSGWGLRLDIHDLVMRRDDLAQVNPRAALLAAQRDLADLDFDADDPTTWGPDGGRDGIVGQEPYFPHDFRGKRWLNNYTFSLSLTVPIGWVWKDGDGDMIEDRFDRCLTTAPGVVVDAAGCGIDSDEDGVFDGLDRCADTPLGATVDIGGCPSDGDKDGVLDGLDQCEDTPEGAIVDLQGCPRDSDGDGVLDGLDQCVDTPLGAAIDEVGCVLDPVEAALLDGETILVGEVKFEDGVADLEPLSYHYVNKIGRLLERWTGNEERPMRIEIGVHTDGIGSEEFNLELSQRRANTIRRYMLENFFEMGENNLIAVGYGESVPVADNSTREGQLRNRRVEVRLLGEGDPPETYDFGAPEGETGAGEAEATTPGGEGPGEEEGAPEGVVPDLPEPEMPDLPEEPEMPDLPE